MSPNTWKYIQTDRTFILLSLLCFSHLTVVLGDSETEAEADLLHRHIRDVQVRLVPAPNTVPENVNNDVTLYNVSLTAPNRDYTITNSSAGVNNMFQVTNGLLRLRPSLPADQRKLFDYERFKTFDVTINCTNQTDPADVIILTVRIALSDVDDEPPVFTNKPKPFLATVDSNPAPGTVVFTVSVVDPDTNGDLTFGIDQVTYQGQPFNGRFQSKLLDGGTPAQKTYNIITDGGGALTPGAEYNIKITANDVNTVAGQQQVSENIIVRVGNRPPQFFEQSYKGRIYETTGTNSVLEMDSSNKLLIRVMQFQPGSQLTYQLLEQSNRPSQFFDIQADDNNAQRIVNRMPLDYETTTYASLTIKVTEGATGLTSTVPITINIVDENDNAPVFIASQYTATVREDLPVGTSVLKVTAIDQDSGLYGEIVFSLVNSTFFDVTTSNINKTYYGTVNVKNPLDYDSDPRPRQFTIVASDKGTPALSSPVQGMVFLQNVNDNPPTIVNTTSTFYLNETAQVNNVVTLIQASDIDGDTFKFYFEGKKATSDIFTIRESNGQIFLNSGIPKEINAYILKVIVIDDDNCCGGIKTGQKTATATFTVNIVDINVNKPSFNDCLLYDTTAAVKEMSPVGTPVIQVSASDPDRGENGVVIYRIETPEANSDRDVFQINSTTGTITVKKTILRDNYDVIQLTVVGRNPPSFPLMEGRCTFRVTIIDVNNHPPTFPQALYTIPLSFSTTPPYIVTPMAASDKDVGVNANITYSFGMNDTVALRTFSIHPLSGVIRLDQSLNQSITSYILIVVANDNGKDPGPLTGNTTVNVTISFDKRQPPVWLNNAPDNAAYNVSEDSPRGYVITTLACQANSSDTGVEFRVFDAGDTITSDSKNFFIVSFTENGISKMNLSLRNSLNYEIKTTYTLSIVCQSLSAEVLRARLLTRVVNVLDANDEIPEFVGLDSNGRYRGTVAEDALPGATVLQVTARDLDSTAAYNTVVFSLDGQYKDFFQVKSLGNNRADIVTTSALKLDRENQSQYTVQIVAQDTAPASPPDANNPNLPNIASRYIDVIVTDVNDNPPKFPENLYQFNCSENAPVSFVVGIVKANDPDEIDQGLGLDYRFTSGNEFSAFNIISITGEVRVAKKLDYDNPQEQKNYTLTLIALDSNQRHTATTTVKIMLNDENDNRPIFTQNSYRVDNKVTEEDTSITRQNPLFLVQVMATDADVARPNTIRYSLYNPSQSNVDQLFTVDAVSGNVSLIGPLDRDIAPYFYTITIEATDEIVNPLNNFADVFVYPLDINDNDPEFDPQYLQGSVKEHLAVSIVMTLSANDKDYGDNGTVHYEIAPNQPNPTLASMFEVRQSGEIYTRNNVTLLDRETIEFVYLAVVAYDLGTPSRSSTATATISIIDINDQPPFFENPLYSVSISENQKADKILTISAKDLDSDPKNREMVFTLEGNETRFFRVDSVGNDAVIYVIQAIDYEKDPHVFTFTVHVKGGEPGQENSTKVQVIILDYNDNAPVFNTSVKSITLVEEEQPGVAIANFTATDADEGLNAEIEYSIDRATDPRYEYYIDPTTGVVTTRKRLDREVQELITLRILAIDKGEIPLTGTATLSITLTDINDNAPSFRENYRPVVPENVDNSNTEVQVIYAKDPDTRQYGPPFGFALPDGCSVPACTFFTLTFNENGDGGNGTATVRTSARFDREQMKYYYLPIVMWDMRGKQGSMTATNTLTITIGDENDNTLEDGNQNILVYNYEGQFKNTEIGRAYVEDPDDWDLPDKTFKYDSPDNLKDYFSVNEQTGMITIKSDVPANNDQSPYQFKVKVFDRKFQKTVTSTISVTVQLITDETVRKSGGVRLEGITADEFVKPTKTTPSTSRYTQFRQAVSRMLGYPSLENIQIVSLTEGYNFLDVWFSAHGSPYVNPSQGESAVMLNKDEFEKSVGLKVLQVPINLCMEENSDIGCYNFFNVTGEPELVNSNGTSYVMMRTNLTHVEGCVDSMFPDPVECRGDYCFNGGTCIQDDWGKLSCACSPEFDGPRCQQLRHSFDGTSTAFYQGLAVCSEGRTSIDFVTVQEDGLIMYSGPVSTVNQNEDALDYLILELKAGYPSLRVNLGGQEVSLQLTGKDSANTIRMQKLSDGVWHHLDIDRNNQRVTLTVDHCETAAITNGTVSDWSPCRVSAVVPGPDVLLNVKSFLQLGGRYTTNPAYPPGITNKGFNGCLKNLKHNTKLYDLYYKELPSWKSGNNGCPREEAICGQGTAQPQCGKNATCEANWQTNAVVSCRCYPGWYGPKCDKVAPTKDLQTNSFFAWQLTQVLINGAQRETSFQMMYRTRQITGTLFVLTDTHFNTVALKLVNGKLSLSYDMGKGITSLVLDNAAANTGQWTTIRVERYGNEFLLILDGGEGRNYAYKTADTNLGVLFDISPRVIVGAAQVTSAGSVSDDLASTCVRDIRFNDYWLPLTMDQNNDPDAGAKLTESKGIQEGCVRDDCGPSVTCPPGTYCYPLWEAHACRCTAIGTSLVNGVCIATCVPNPCYNSGVCSVASGKPVCVCPIGWSGPLCEAQAQVNPDDAGLGPGAIAGIVIAILLLLILLILLLIFLLTRKRSEKEKFIEVDPDDDYIRENVMYYNEEGAGEEDHAAYDLRLLQKPVKETDAKLVFSPVTESEMKARNAPKMDRPDIAPRSDRPDVGTFIKDRINEAENDDPLNDSTREFNFEGGNSDAGSLSSLNTSSSGGSQDYDYLSDWGPKFAKLADMYGAGQDLDYA